MNAKHCAPIVNIVAVQKVISVLHLCTQKNGLCDRSIKRSQRQNWNKPKTYVENTKYRLTLSHVVGWREWERNVAGRKMYMFFLCVWLCHNPTAVCASLMHVHFVYRISFIKYEASKLLNVEWYDCLAGCTDLFISLIYSLLFNMDSSQLTSYFQHVNSPISKKLKIVWGNKVTRWMQDDIASKILKRKKIAPPWQ